MEQQQVEVAARGEFRASVAADGDEGDPAGSGAPAVKRSASHASVSVARAERRGGPDRAFSLRRRSRAAA